MRQRRRSAAVLDTSRLAAALERPGIDTRVWTSLAVVDKVVIDTETGVFVDVVLMPANEPATARLGTEYAGTGFGLYLPLEKGDEVVVEAPNGNPSEGYVITKRLWNGADTPPTEAKDKPADLLLKVQKDKNLRIKMVGGGNVVIIVADGKVLLGDETGTSPVHRKGDHTDLGTWAHVPAAGVGVTPCQLLWVPPGGGAPQVVPPAGANLTGQAKDGSGKVEAK